jgi:hypothetical protein
MSAEGRSLRTLWKALGGDTEPSGAKRVFESAARDAVRAGSTSVVNARSRHATTASGPYARDGDRRVW